MPSGEDTLRAAGRDSSPQFSALRQVHAVSVELIGDQPVDALYERFLDAATAIMRSEYSSIQMLDDEPEHRGELRLLGHRGFNPAAALFWTWVRPASQSTCGAALRTRMRVMVPDVETCEWMAGTEDLETYRNTGIRAVQTTPLVARDGRTLGMISTHWARPHRPADSEFRLLDVLARQAADLIERSRQEAELEKAETRFRTLVEMLSDVPWLADVNGAFEPNQPSWAAYTGQSSDQCAGFGWIDAFHPDDRDVVRTAFRRARENATPLQTDARLWHGASLRWRQCLVKAAPIVSAKGIQEWVGACVDIEEQRAAREALVGAKTAAERKSDAKSTYMAVLSHELRNPLNAIAGYVEMLDLEVDGPMTPKQRMSLERIRHSNEHLLRLIKGLLDVGRIEAGRVEYAMGRVELADVVGTVLPLVEAQVAAKSLHLEYARAVGVRVVTDAEKLQQILLNLLGNAIKFTPPGGRIAVSIHARSERPGVVFVRVGDTGPGVPAEWQDDIFLPFVRVSNQSTEGAGLGLAISRDLARAMGGDLRVRSASGNGAAFTLTLPNADAPPA